MALQKYRYYKSRVEKIEKHLLKNHTDGDARHKLKVYRALMLKIRNILPKEIRE